MKLTNEQILEDAISADLMWQHSNVNVGLVPSIATIEKLTKFAELTKARAIPVGYVLVPIVPSQAMLNVFSKYFELNDEGYVFAFADIWKDLMLESAQQQRNKSMNKEANIKTVLEAPKKVEGYATDEPYSCGYSEGRNDAINDFEAWNRQNIEPVLYQYQDETGEWIDTSEKYYEKYSYDYEVRKLFTAPPQPQSVKDALEMAAKVCDGRCQFGTGERIRALIDQPAKG